MDGGEKVIINTDKMISSIAFVGVNKRWQKPFGQIKKKGIVITFQSDYEKSKEWVLKRIIENPTITIITSGIMVK